MKRPEISASYKETSAPPNSSKKRESTLVVWKHFIKETDQNGMVRAKCKCCGQGFSGSSKDVTTHLNNHWKSSKCKRSQKETSGLENPTVTNGNFVFDEERSGLDLVRMIIKNGDLLNMIGHEDFKIFVKNLQPTFKLPSQDTLKDKILRINREEKEKLRKQFEKLFSFSLILNFWTDCGKKNKYCSFTLQFIEDGPKLKKIIAIKNVEYDYTGETLFEIVKGVLLEWNIDKKLASITIERSSANDEMVKILERWLDYQGNHHPFKGQIFIIPCITHLLNLLVQDGLDDIDNILCKIRKAIKYMSETTTGNQKFEEVVKKLNLAGEDITSEGVPLRWDSILFMLQIALELRGGASVDPQSSDCVFRINLSTEEWDKAEVMHNCLTVFYDAICSFFGSKCPSTNVYFIKIFYIYGSLLQWQESDIVKKMRVTFDEYFDRCTFVSAIAAVFDPQTNLEFVHYSFRDLYDDGTKKHTVIDDALRHIFGVYAKDHCSQGLSSSFPSNDNSTSSYGDNPRDILEKWKKSQRASQMTELDQYLREPPLHFEGEFDIFGWWRTKGQYFPILRKMACDILAIPMSTSTSNSVFCIETPTIDPIFNGLDPDIIEALFCGKDWLDNTIRITTNKDNDHSTSNPEPKLENSGSTSGPVLPRTGDISHVWSGTSEPQEKHSLSFANTEVVLENCSTTSCPEPLPLPTKEVNKMKRPEISASYKVTSAPPNSSKKRKSTSDVWNHLIKETDENGKVWAKCKHCRKRFSGLSKDGTTHLKNHLNSSKCKRSQKEMISSSKTGGLENPTVTNGNFVFDEERSSLDLVRMIIKNGYPLNMVEHEDLKIFVKNLQPTFKLPSQDTLKDKILCVYREEKEKLRKQVDKLSSCSLILNFWKGHGKKNKYCSFTLQSIEDGLRLKKKIIALKNLEYNYTGETLFQMVKGLLLEWNIGKKLASITVESSSANDQMKEILESWLGDQGNCHPFFRGKIFRIPCVTHLINLLVQDGLDEIDDILYKMRKVIKCMSKTMFEEVVKKFNLEGNDITSEGVPLRWDSTFFMLQFVLRLRWEAFFDLDCFYCIYLMNLSEEEWVKVEVMHKCLTVFYNGIDSSFRSKCLSTIVYFGKIFDIYGSLHQWQESDIVKKMIVTFDKFFDCCTFVSAIAAVFDPRTNLEFVRYSFRDLYGDDTKKHTVIDDALSHMFGAYAKDLGSQGLSSSFPSNDNSSSSYGDNPRDILEKWKTLQRGSQMTELDQYLREPPLLFEGEFDIFGWWHTKGQYFPILRKMACDILAIPMSTSTSNSVFCIETPTIDPIFNGLDSDIIEALFCGKDWLDNITAYKDNDHSTSNPEPMLENPGSTSGPEPLQTGDISHVW